VCDYLVVPCWLPMVDAGVWAIRRFLTLVSHHFAARESTCAASSPATKQARCPVTGPALGLVWRSAVRRPRRLPQVAIAWPDEQPVIVSLTPESCGAPQTAPLALLLSGTARMCGVCAVHGCNVSGWGAATALWCVEVPQPPQRNMSDAYCSQHAHRRCVVLVPDKRLLAVAQGGLRPDAARLAGFPPRPSRPAACASGVENIPMPAAQTLGGVRFSCYLYVKPMELR